MKRERLHSMKNKVPGLAAVLLLSLWAIPTAVSAGEDSFAASAPVPPAVPEAPVPPEPPLPVAAAGQTMAFASAGGFPDRRDGIWLGVGVAETTEPLTAQLGLKPGEGLVISYVSTNSPAAAAGLKKNDVLVELDGQMLVDPTQLRKLVQMHADGETVSVEYYRAGKKQTASAKVTKRTGGEVFFDEDAMPDDRKNFWLRLNNRQDWPGGGGGGSGGIGGGGAKVEIEIQRAMEGAQKTLQEALQQSMNGPNGLNEKLQTLNKQLGPLAAGGVKLGKKTTVIVSKDDESVRTMVKKDESGTYVIVADPAKRLTAHDPAGKLLYDGEIETPEQQKKVPQDVWKKVEPMLKDLDHEAMKGVKVTPEADSPEN